MVPGPLATRADVDALRNDIENFRVEVLGALPDLAGQDDQG